MFQVELANQFAEIVQTDPRFELPTPPRLKKKSNL